MVAAACERRSKRRGFRCARNSRWWWRALLVFGLSMVCSAATAGDFEDAEKLFRTGKYAECARAAQAGIENDGWTEPWRHLKIKTRAGARKRQGSDRCS